MRVSVAQESFDAHVADLLILQAKSVQKAIGVTDAQRAKMNGYSSRFEQEKSAYQAELVKSKAKPNYQKITGFLMKFRQEVFSQLSGAQLQRLREISLQHDGVPALQDQVVAKRVGLSDAQLQKIRGIIVADGKKMASMRDQAAQPIILKYKNLKPKNATEGKALEDKFRTEMQAIAAKYAPQIKRLVIQDRSQIIGVLNAKQKTVWDSLLGKPFKG